MSNKTRKHIWPASLVMALAIVGVLAAFVVLAATPGSTSAHTADGDHDQECLDMTPEAMAQHDEDELLINADDPMLCTEPTDDGGNGNGNGNGANGANGGNGNGDAPEHAGEPRYFELEVLDNGVRLNWVKPGLCDTVAEGGRDRSLPDSSGRLCRGPGRIRSMSTAIPPLR